MTGLLELRALGLIVKDALVDTAKILVALTGFDDVELKGVHEHIEQFKSAIQLGGRQSFLKCLTASFSISLERSEKTVESMTGKVKFDVARLAEAINALFEDISEQGYDVVLYLDNLDELHHEYRNAAARDAVRNDVAALLSLRKSPIVLVVNVRTYFSSILGREFPYRRVIARMSDDDLLNTAYLRLADEPSDVRAILTDSGCRAAALKLRR